MVSASSSLNTYSTHSTHGFGYTQQFLNQFFLVIIYTLMIKDQATRTIQILYVLYELLHKSFKYVLVHKHKFYIEWDPVFSLFIMSVNDIYNKI